MTSQGRSLLPQHQSLLDASGIGVEVARAPGYLSAQSRRHECPGAVPVIACHDEIAVECDAERGDTTVEWLCRAMHEAMTPLLAPCPSSWT